MVSNNIQYMFNCEDMVRICLSCYDKIISIDNSLKNRFVKINFTYKTKCYDLSSDKGMYCKLCKIKTLFSKGVVKE